MDTSHAPTRELLAVGKEFREQRVFLFLFCVISCEDGAISEKPVPAALPTGGKTFN